jgi:hypothetical protein
LEGKVFGRYLRKTKSRIKRSIKNKPPLSYIPALDGKHFLFIGGLHRSGTSIFHRLLREHPATSGFTDTGVPQDEGQHLQTTFPPAITLGGPGRFAFHPNSHLTEDSDLATETNRDRLLREWGAYYDLSRDVLLEKSPPNVIRSRFFQALFPDARFVFIVRHPIVVTLATRKWSQTSIAELMFHWCVAYRLMVQDLKVVRNHVVIRYEDFIASPQTHLDRIYDLVGIEARKPGEVVEDHNRNYFAAWEHEDSRDHELAEMAVANDPDLLTRFGYSLSKPYVHDMT